MRQRGFGIVLVVVAIGLLAVVGALGYLLAYKKPNQVSQLPTPIAQATQKPQASPKSKASPAAKLLTTVMGNVTISYPPQWSFTASPLSNNGTAVYGRPAGTNALYPKIVIEIVPKSQMSLAARLGGLEKVGFTASQTQFHTIPATLAQATLPNIADAKQVISSKFTLFEKGDYLYMIGYEAGVTDANLKSIQDIVNNNITVGQ